MINIKKFSPKGLAQVKTLTNEGMRTVGTLYLLCNPNDEAEYVDPCLYGESLAEDTGASFMSIKDCG